ncbi:MAG: FAD-dependent oxidoreductase [Saprospiraceae bacterium]|nr:FAD-dependent oxidoreductase [Saprospiraceae bacterium]
MKGDIERVVIVGASHGGVTAAFALRKEGWQGEIVLIDRDPHLPYHRPPLSKDLLKNAQGEAQDHLLRSEANYEQKEIHLVLDATVRSIDRTNRQVVLESRIAYSYTKLILALGGRPIVPEIPGLQTSARVQCIRTLADTLRIKALLKEKDQQNVVVIGAGYIGLEAAASLATLHHKVTILEREDRALARVTSADASAYFDDLHRQHGVALFYGQEVTAYDEKDGTVHCASGKVFSADIVIIGVGILPNVALAKEAGIEVADGIAINGATQTSDPHIYAIGDCAWYYNEYYGRNVRLESVQNAVDQAKVSAKDITGQPARYDSIPWFWSDQYDVKMQMVGLMDGHDKQVVRKGKHDDRSMSIWFFDSSTLLAVHAINDPKAYVMGTRYLKNRAVLDQALLSDVDCDLKEVLLA